jgi:hypothetical protein
MLRDTGCVVFQVADQRREDRKKFLEWKDSYNGGTNQYYDKYRDMNEDKREDG